MGGPRLAPSVLAMTLLLQAALLENWTWLTYTAQASSAGGHTLLKLGSDAAPKTFLILPSKQQSEASCHDRSLHVL